MPNITGSRRIVSTAQLADNVVERADVADNAIGDDEIGAHTTTKITVPTTKLSGTILEAQIADGAVAIGKLKAATQGDIIYYGASGVPALLGVGTSGYVLKSQGPGANPIWQASAGDWQQLDDITGGGSSSLTTNTFSARKLLRIYVYGAGFSTTSAPRFRFNGDSGTNYATKVTQNGSASVDLDQQTRVAIQNSNYTTPFGITIDVFNESASARKFGTFLAVQGYDSNIGAPEIFTGSFLWSNTSAQITTFTLLSEAGNLNSGTRIVVYGKND